MFFRKQKFFLDLTGQQDTEQKGKAGQEPSVTIAPPVAPKPEKAAAQPAAKAAPAKAATPAAPAAAQVAAETAPAAAAAPASVRTTAEEIAAQLAAEAASRPAPTLSTFAPDCLTPGASTPRRRRSAGANLGAFKEIARGLMKS
ncbi:MAG: hypothetical protein VKN83_05245 [Cyanobacteriota bacterium]|jgi:hypothetical protein|nr:hypothetical protein [Cyanobacteriota bacterium]